MKTYGSFFFLAGLGGEGGVLATALGFSGFGMEMEGRERDGSLVSFFLGGGGVVTLGFSGVDTGKLMSTLGREILGSSNEGVGC